MSEVLYRFAWRNNPKRETLYDRTCRIVGRMKKNSIVVEFVDNGEREVVSRNAVRRIVGNGGAA